MERQKSLLLLLLISELPSVFLQNDNLVCYQTSNEAGSDACIYRGTPGKMGERGSKGEKGDSSQTDENKIEELENRLQDMNQTLSEISRQFGAITNQIRDLSIRVPSSCSYNPCVNGNCTELNKNYTCVCFPGYTGRNCEQDVDECAQLPSPCVEGRVCTNTVGSFECSSCSERFNDDGTVCKKQIECDTTFNEAYEGYIPLVVTCPSDCASSSGEVIGFRTYSGQSSICRSALLDGNRVSDSQGLILANTTVPPRFTAFSRNGIASIGVESNSGDSAFVLGGFYMMQKITDYVLFSAYEVFPWRSTRNRCEEFGGRLATAFIRNETIRGELDLSTNYWIGLNDTEMNNQWFWIDGVEANPATTDWRAGEPNNTDDMDCGAYSNRVRDRGIFSQSCTSRHYGLCSAPIKPLTY